MLVFCSLIVLAQAPSSTSRPEIGTWKQNFEKSKYAAGTTPPRSSIRRYEARPDGFFVTTNETVDAQGNPTFGQVVYKYDGKDYGFPSQITLAEFLATGKKTWTTQAFMVMDANTVQATAKDNTGKVTGTFVRQVSKDGKTITQTGKDTSGKITNVTVFDKQ